MRKQLVLCCRSRAPDHSAGRSADRPQSRRACAPVSAQSQPGPTADVNGSVTVCVWAHDRVRVRGHVHGRVIVHACACVPVGPQRECMPWRKQTRAYVDVGAGVGVVLGTAVLHRTIAHLAQPWFAAPLIYQSITKHGSRKSVSRCPG